MPENEYGKQEHPDAFNGTDSQSDFMIEKIKERPVNKKKLIRRTMITAAMAVIFGTIACVTFLIMEPLISNWLYPEEEPEQVSFPEDLEEMAPEDMLSENLSGNEGIDSGEGNAPLEQDQIQEILSGIVLDMDNYKQIYMALSSYVSELNHSMVTVTGVSSNVDWFNNVEVSRNQSPGVIIANNGKELLVLADYVPLKRAESLSLSFSYLEGVEISAEIKGVDTTTNLAVLSVNLADLPQEMLQPDGIVIASLGSSNLRNIVGTPVIALGSPMGSSGSMGYGMITASTLQNNQADANYKILQTDIYGSSSAGGVIFSLQGQVLGIITNQKNTADMKNIVTAYGITELKKTIEKLSNGEKIAYLGISGIDVTDEANEEMGVPYGAFVIDVDMNSPSMEAGIQQGDVITAFDGHSVHSYNDYITALMQAEAGSGVELTVMRAAQGTYKEMNIRVTLTQR